jgi:hypothetical protein
MRLRRRAITLMLLLGVLGVTPAYAGAADAPRCHIDFNRSKRFGYVIYSATFMVRSPGPRGAIGVWRDDSGDRVGLRVDRGEGKASKTRRGVGRGDYQLVRCETVR